MRRYKLFNLTKALLALFLVSSFYYSGGQNAPPAVTITINPSPDFESQSVISCNGATVNLQLAIEDLENATIDEVQFSTVGGNNFETGLIDNPESYTVTGPITIYARATNNDTECKSSIASFDIVINTIIAPPYAISPQTFCTGAIVADLQVRGNQVKWLDADYHLLLDDAPLDNGVYYAVETVDECQSDRYSPVEVIINDNVFLDAPYIPGPFTFCAPAYLSDIPTDGNSNIVWYDALTGGTKYEDPSTVELVDGQSYFAAQSGGGDCVSTLRTEVTVALNNVAPQAPEMETPQHFCNGSLIGHLVVANNQIIWYADASGGEPLGTDNQLETGIYYASQCCGSCESAVRTPVNVVVDQYSAPQINSLQCVTTILNLSDVPMAGFGMVWYDVETGGTPLPLSTTVSLNTDYWIAQSNGDCESTRVKVNFTSECYNPRGTIFPFVHTGDSTFDNQFITTVKLYSLPPAATLNKISYVRSKSLKLFETVAIYYDDTTYIASAPKYPGVIGFFNNPGNPILWSAINQSGATPNNTTVAEVGNPPMSPIGQFGFENVAPGQYVIEVARQGFLTRYGVVTIGAGNNDLGHREILGGDVNGDLNINDKDFSVIVSKYSTYMQPNYKWEYDIDGSSKAGSDDVGIIKIYLGAYAGTIYEETANFLNNNY